MVVQEVTSMKEEQVIMQVRVDKLTKQVATKVFEEMGLTLSAAVRLFLKKAVVTGRLPFDPSIDETSLDFARAVQSIRNTFLTNGYGDMTLDEVNEVIAEVRRERHTKEK